MTQEIQLTRGDGIGIAQFFPLGDLLLPLLPLAAVLAD